MERGAQAEHGEALERGEANNARKILLRPSLMFPNVPKINHNTAKELGRVAYRHKNQQIWVCTKY